MYVYCTKTHTPTFNGCYSNTPNEWIEKYFIIEKSLEIREKKLMEKINNAR